MLNIVVEEKRFVLDGGLVCANSTHLSNFVGVGDNAWVNIYVLSKYIIAGK